MNLDDLPVAVAFVNVGCMHDNAVSNRSLHLDILFLEIPTCQPAAYGPFPFLQRWAAERRRTVGK